LTERAQLRRILAQLDAGDVLMVTRLDRLARSTRDLPETLAATEKKGGRISFARRRMGRHTGAHGPQTELNEQQKREAICSRDHDGARDRPQL
jgi:DNA invertase Pin-like site-specific DNA recombinase